MITHRAIKHYILLLAFALIFILILCGVNKILPFFPAENLLPLTGGFTFVAMTALAVFFYGTEGNEEKKVFATLVAIGLKMLLSFVLALVFIVVFKNKDTGSIILFFILYLGFTVFVFLAFLRIIKGKSD